MNYLIKLFFMDGKDMDISVPVENINMFLNAIGKNNLYFDDIKEIGIWIPIDRIRYFIIKKSTNGES